MAQSCTVKLPKDVRLGDVLDVIGILTGSKAEWEMLGGRWVEVDGIAGWPICKTENISDDYNVYGQEGCGFGHYVVHVRKNTFDKDHHVAFWNYETSGDYYLLMSGECSLFWNAINTELARFFGGEVDYNDCDDIEVDVRFDKPRVKNNPGDGQEWDDFQNDKYNVQPITDWQQYNADRIRTKDGKK